MDAISLLSAPMEARGLTRCTLAWLAMLTWPAAGIRCSEEYGGTVACVAREALEAAAL